MNMIKNIEKTLKRFTKQTDLHVDLQSGFFLLSIDQPFDASIVIKIGKAKYPFLVAYVQRGRRNPRSGGIPNLLEMGDLSTEYKRKLQDAKIAYIADDGDFFIPLTLSNIGSQEKSSQSSAGTLQVSRPLENFPSSVAMAKFIHFLVARDQNPKATQKIMADEVGISMAAVNKYLRELEDANYIVNDKNRIRFVDPGKLLELWTAEYIKRILPRTEKQRFDPYDDKQYKEFRASPFMLKKGYWSATKGADVLNQSELPERFIIYSDKPMEVVKELRLRPSVSGSIEIRQKFWNFEWKEARQGIVDLPLIYADLMDNADPRDIKTAKDIRDIWIKSL